MQVHIVENNTKKLSAIVDVDSFFYGIFDENYRLLFSERKSFESSISEDQFKSVLNSIPQLNGEYGEIHLTCKTAQTSFLPKDVDMPPSGDNFSTWVSNPFIHQDVEVFWAIDDQLVSALQYKFPDTSILHISTVFSDFIYPSQRKAFMAHFEKDTLHLMHYKQGVFQYYNSFKVKEGEDYLYFLMQGYHVLNLDPQKDALIISGDLIEGSQLHKLIQRYILNIDFIQPERFLLKESLPASVKHRYFDLYANVICG